MSDVAGMMLSAEVRKQCGLYVLEIRTDHKLSGDGKIVPFDRIVFGKKGSGDTWEPSVKTLKGEFPDIWDMFESVYTRWQKDNTIADEGTPLETWTGIDRTLIKSCKAIGLRSVEDIATASSAIKDKLGMGAIGLIARAKMFLENKDKAEATNKLATMESEMASMKEQLDRFQAEAERANKRPTKAA